MKAHNYTLSLPLPKLPWPRFVGNVAQNTIVIRGCSHEIRNAWQIWGGSLITQILKHFSLNDKEWLFTPLVNKWTHVYFWKTLVFWAFAWLHHAGRSPQRILFGGSFFSKDTRIKQQKNFLSKIVWSGQPLISECWYYSKQFWKFVVTHDYF